MANHLRDIIVAETTALPITEIAGFPVLQSLLTWWSGTANGAPPATVDPLDLPPAVLPHLMLVDLVGTDDARIRLAGTLPCQLYGRELKGTSVHDFFAAEDARGVLGDLQKTAASLSPSLAHRSYVSVNDRIWSYTRLLLPLCPDGPDSTRVLKALEPKSFRDAQAK